jgi:hypothetical protein
MVRTGFSLSFGVFYMRDELGFQPALNHGFCWILHDDGNVKVLWTEIGIVQKMGDADATFCVFFAHSTPSYIFVLQAVSL